MFSFYKFTINDQNLELNERQHFNITKCESKKERNVNYVLRSILRITIHNNTLYKLHMLYIASTTYNT